MRKMKKIVLDDLNVPNEIKKKTLNITATGSKTKTDP